MEKRYQFWSGFVATLVSALFLLASVSSSWSEARPSQLAFLGVTLQNDNATLEPTTEAETKRVAALERQFLSSAGGSGIYSIVPVTDAVRSEIQSGQALGSCGGCEVAFGKELHADRVAWIAVQKVSNLILNLNLYVADVASGQLTYVKSVDIRGNTDESWSRSLRYLLDNYFLAGKS